MEVIDVQHPWDQQQQHEDVSSDELEESLITRKKNINQIPLPPTKDEQEQEQEQKHEDEEEEEAKDYNAQKGIKVEEDVKEEEKQEKPEYSVYYDKDKGIGVGEADGVDSATNEKVPVLENTDTAIHNQENGNGVHSPISNQNGEHQKDDSFPEIASLEQVDKSSPSPIKNKSEISEIQVIEDGDDEIAEFDVETVLKKQGTHDLFCPNCNSCITKRVILRKRKRQIPVTGEDSKRNKPENPAPSEVNVASSDSGDNQAQNGVDSRIDEVQPLISNEYDHQREPDVFRCLSCFSIFMPTGNGFKLFQMFGNKSNEESDQPTQKEVPVKRHWFSKFFASDKVQQGAVQSLDATNNIAGASAVSSNLNTPRQGVNSPATNGEVTTNTPLVADTHEQLLTSYNTEESNDKSDYPGMFVVKPPSDNVEAAENSISPLINDGLKLVIPPNVGSLIIDNSQMNQELDVTVQTNNPDINEKGSTNLSFSPPDPTLGHLNLGGQTNNLGIPTNLAINGKEQKMYKDK
nr:membrane protein of ER body-like protein isoform X1 [Tanacetum cinerariifolium]